MPRPRRRAERMKTKTGGPGAQTYGIIDATPPIKSRTKSAMALWTWRACGPKSIPAQEWKQIFNEVWRQERDYFFAAAMNGVDWAKKREQYAPLLPYVADRYDLTYVLGEMIGELSNSHTYVGGGDYPDLKPVNVGLLGDDFERRRRQRPVPLQEDLSPERTGRRSVRSPLTEPGVNVKEGDYLLAVNGRPLRAPQTPYELLVNTAERECHADGELEALRGGRPQRAGQAHRR